jgi:dTDP-4-amino-4,6-dideoxygalactose transaminase
MKVKFLKTNISKADLKRVWAAIETDMLVSGPESTKFEQACDKYFNLPCSVFMSSATAALHVALELAGVTDGDEVITTPLSWVATTNVIELCGAKPVFVDVEANTGLMDPKKIEAAITERTKAIMPVHLYGQMADMKAIMAIADRHNLKVIEDSSHAFETERDEIRPGQLSFAACFSFHATKNMAAGQGGLFITRHKELEDKARALINQGVHRDENGHRRMSIFGYKYTATDLQAALLLAQFDRLEKTHKKRLKLHKRYEKLVKAIGHPELKVMKRIKNAEHAAHIFSVLVPANKRLAIMKHMGEKGVAVAVHYDPIHLEPFYRDAYGFQHGMYPNCENIGASTISLPLYSKLTVVEQDYVATCLAEAVEKHLGTSAHAA